MMYQTSDLNIIATNGQSRSRYANNQSCVNYYIEGQTSGRTPATLLPWPVENYNVSPANVVNNGLIEGEARGIFYHKGRVYCIVNTQLYSSDFLSEIFGGIFGESSIDELEFGPLALVTGTGRVSFCALGESLVMTTNGSTCCAFNGIVYTNAPRVFVWDRRGTSFNNPSYATASTTLEDISASNSFDPSTFDILDTIRTESRADRLLQLFQFENYIVAGSSDSIDFYEDNPAVRPPISLISQASTKAVGVASPYSMASTTNFLYFLGSDRSVYRISALRAEKKSGPDVNFLLRKASDVGDAAGISAKIDGADFYILQLPAAGITLAFNESNETWTRISSGTTLGRHDIFGGVYQPNSNGMICQSFDLGRVFKWDLDFNQYNGKQILRRVDTAPINLSGQRMIMQRIRFMCQAQGNSSQMRPKYRISYSLDGGASFSQDDWLFVNDQEQGFAIIDWYREIVFYDIIIRIDITDGIFSAMHGATIDMKPAGY